MERLRVWRKRNSLRRQFETVPTVSGIYVATIGSLHDSEELTQQSISVERCRLIDSFMDGVNDCAEFFQTLCCCLPFRFCIDPVLVRVESGFEVFDQPSCNRWIG